MNITTRENKKDFIYQKAQKSTRLKRSKSGAKGLVKSEAIGVRP